MSVHVLVKGSLALTLLLVALFAATTRELTANAAGQCNGLAATIEGTNGSDTINGTAGNDVIIGNNGDDVINGNGGNDTICGGSGDDEITTLGGNDWIDGGNGEDEINAGAGNNTVYGGNDDDEIETGSGNDYVDGGNGDDEISTGAGSDTLIGWLGDDDLDGGADVDSCDGGAGTNNLINCETSSTGSSSSVASSTPASSVASSVASSTTSSSVVSSTPASTVSSASAASSAGFSLSLSFSIPSIPCILCSSSAASSVVSTSSVTSAGSAGSVVSTTSSVVSSAPASVASSTASTGTGGGNTQTAGAVGEGDQSGGTRRGHQTTLMFAALRSSIIQASGMSWRFITMGLPVNTQENGDEENGVAPAAFGGGAEMTANARKKVICGAYRTLHRHEDRLDARGWVADLLSSTLGWDTDFLEKTFRDPESCVTPLQAGRIQHGEQKVAVEVPVGPLGNPISSNPVWNKCVLGDATLQDIRNNPHRNEIHGRDCSDYHTGDVWRHYDLGIYFEWNADTHNLVLPEGYEAVPSTLVTEL